MCTLVHNLCIMYAFSSTNKLRALSVPHNATLDPKSLHPNEETTYQSHTITYNNKSAVKSPTETPEIVV